MLDDYSSDYKSRLISLKLLPLSIVIELNDIPFFLKSLRSPTSAFDILDYVSFCSSNSRSSSSHKLNHSHCSSTLSSHFYFKRLPIFGTFCLFLTKIFLRGQLRISLIKDYIWTYFLEHYNSADPCSFHISCPCTNCLSAFSNRPNFV